MSDASGGLRLLLGLEARRAAAAFRHPRPGVLAALAVPAALVAGGLWAAGDAARPDLSTDEGRILLGVLVSAPTAFFAYPLLFRAEDDGLLRRLGVPARAVFAVRAARLLAAALAAVLLLMLPFLRAAEDPPLGAALAAALTGWGVSLFTFAGAARRLADPNAGRSLGGMFIGWDPELAAAAPLVYAPIVPVIVGALAGAAASVRPAIALPGCIALAGALALVAARRFARALPRFAPRAGEMAFAPPPAESDTELVVDRGLARLLPRRAAAVRARDAAVVGRRYRWAARLVPPLAVIAVLALLRAGHDPAVRRWVATACVLALAAQALAVIALGRLERRRLRWMDRALGLGWADRLLGRWALAFGLALGVVIPVALTWAFSVPTSPGWWWIAGAAASAVLASAVSLAAAGR